MTVLVFRAMKSWIPSALGLALVALASCSVPDFEFSSSGGADGGPGGTAGAGGGSGGSAGTGATGTGATGGTGAATGGGGSPTGGTGGVTTCSTHADCATAAGTPKCNPANGKCVACLPGLDDVCPSGFYCAGTACKAGCKTSAECTSPLTCDANHECTGCTGDDDCPAGKLCETSSTKCIPGCTASHACEAGWDCCSGACVVALSLNPEHCGACGNKCVVPPPGTKATVTCFQSKCALTCTEVGYQDCNKDPTDGCECGAGKTCQGTSCV